MTIENFYPLGAGVQAAINFASGINSGNNYKYTGSIRTTGTSATAARMGFFTNAGSTPNSLSERLTILDGGNVGINNTNPLYKLSVDGSGYFSTNLGIQTPPSPNFALSVGGNARFHGNLRIDSILNPNNALNIGNDVSIENTLTVEDGKGIVRSTTAIQLKMKGASLSQSVTGFDAGSTIQSDYLNFNEDFTYVTVLVGNVTTGTGEWAKVLIVPFDIDTTNDRCRFRLTNASNSTINFNASWDIVLIGY